MPDKTVYIVSDFLIQGSSSWMFGCQCFGHIFLVDQRRSKHSVPCALAIENVDLLTHCILQCLAMGIRIETNARIFAQINPSLGVCECVPPTNHDFLEAFVISNEWTATLCWIADTCEYEWSLSLNFGQPSNSHPVLPWRRYLQVEWITSLKSGEYDGKPCDLGLPKRHGC